MSTLTELQAELSELTRERCRIVEEAEQAIRLANRSYDRKATSLYRRIERLRDEQQEEIAEHTPHIARASRRPHITIEDGFTPEEVAHYHELLNRKKVG
jgi:hypothetical protein